MAKTRANANPVVIVVSPLLALNKDQMKEAGIPGVSTGQLCVSDDRDITGGKFSIVFGSPDYRNYNNDFSAHSLTDCDWSKTEDSSLYRGNDRLWRYSRGFAQSESGW